jgi:hypothetical protein
MASAEVGIGGKGFLAHPIIKQHFFVFFDFFYTPKNLCPPMPTYAITHKYISLSDLFLHRSIATYSLPMQALNTNALEKVVKQKKGDRDFLSPIVNSFFEI